MERFERALRVQEIWDWLPVFRVVAETEHLPTASEILHVSPSALSRSVRLLESGLGVALFSREGRSIRLNETGQALLLRVRDAMRLVDDGIDEARRAEHRGSIQISVQAPLSPPFVLPAVQALAARHPGITVELVNEPPAGLGDALLGGAIDIAITDQALHAPHLHVDELAVMEQGIHCSTDHPLPSRAVSLERILEHPFVGPRAGDRWDDRWPAHLQRRIGLRTGQMAAAIDACAMGGYLVVLPILVAKAHNLRRLRTDFEDHARLYLVRRTPLPSRGRIDLVAETILARACA